MENLGYIIDLIKTYGYWVIAGGIFLECMGVPFPGETVLVLGGVAASLGHLNLALVIILAATAAVLGDNMGYFIGKKFGRKIIKKLEKFPLFHAKHIDRAEGFFKRHGNKTVFIGRFTAILRTYAALFAGIFDMHYSTFFIYNLTGGILWATIFGFVGFFLGNNMDLIGKIVADVNILFLAIIALFVGWKFGKSFLTKRQLSRDIELKKTHHPAENVEFVIEGPEKSHH
jgi:membrane protein DedA with SNARE-associated domain